MLRASSFYSQMVAVQLLWYLFLKLKRNYFCFTFIAIASIIPNSHLIDQHCLKLCSTSSFLCGKPCILYAFGFSICSIFSRCVSSHVTAGISPMDIQTGMFTENADYAYIYTHSCDFLVIVFCVVIMGQPLHDI